MPKKIEQSVLDALSGKSSAGVVKAEKKPTAPKKETGKKRLTKAIVDDPMLNPNNVATQKKSSQPSKRKNKKIDNDGKGKIIFTCFDDENKRIEKIFYDTFMNEPYQSVTGMCEIAIIEELERLEQTINDGQPFDQISAKQFPVSPTRLKGTKENPLQKRSAYIANDRIDMMRGAILKTANANGPRSLSAFARDAVMRKVEMLESKYNQK